MTIPNNVWIRNAFCNVLTRSILFDLGEIPHHVHTRGRHPQQEEGDLHPVHAQGQADLGQEEEESENIVLVQINFHFLHCTLRILKIFAHSCFCLMSGNTKAVLAINNMLQVV